MADELRLVFIIIGALVLGALLLHGLWTVRKNSGQPRHRYYDEEQQDKAEKPDGFDDFGVGQVRVVKKGSEAPTDNVVAAKPLTAKAEPLKRPVPRQPVAEVQTELAFEEPKEPELNFSALSDDELQQPAFEAPTEQDEPAAAAEEPAEVLILYVLLPESKDMKGPDLLSSLLTLGFKYGDMDIFHRHLDSAGSGAVLFSLANMFNPGTFDLENIEKLSTRGVSLFMTLPGPGEPLQNFNLMHNAAKKLAEEFGGQVLDGQRSVLTVQTVRHYVDKIREFQRQRLIHG
jgi:cell division protein ZipA